MDQQSDEQRVRENVADGFRAILGRSAASLLPARLEGQDKIQVAFETWQAGQYDLTISLLLDAVIKLRQGQDPS